MKKNTLHVLVKRIATYEGDKFKELPLEQYYKKEEGLIILPKYGIINATIKELEDELKLWEKERIKELEKEYKFLKENEKNSDPKIKKRLDAFIKKNNQTQKEKDDEKAVIRSKYNDVRWIWSTVRSKIDFTSKDFNMDFPMGAKEDWFPISEILEGGGMAYLEVFHSNEQKQDDKKKELILANSPSQGILVKAIGTPEISAVLWTDKDGNNLEGKKLHIGSTVKLHIFTKGLYGQEVKIQLMNDDWSDDKLPAFPRKNGVSEDLKKGQKYPDMPSNTFFEREVDVVLLKTGTNTLPSGTTIRNLNDNGALTEHSFVQKCEFKIYLDPFWYGKPYADASNIKLYAGVQHSQADDFQWFKNSFITIDGTKPIVSDLTSTGNNPVVIQKIETNDADFRHCRYNKITLKKQDDSNVIDIFDSAIIEDRRRQNLEIGIIAGEKTVYLLDFILKTEECEKKPKHINHEILISDYTNTVFALSVDASSKSEHIKKDKSKLVKTEVKSTNSLNYFGGAENKEEVKIVQNCGEIKIKKNQIQFDAFYNYDINFSAGALTAFWGIWKYFWLPNIEDKLYKINGQVSSCAFDKPLIIKVYPDIKWSFAIGWNINKDQLSALRPGWDQKNTIEKYEIKAGAISKKRFKTQIDQQTVDKINNNTLETYKTTQGGTLPEKKDDASPKKGKLSTIIEILKETDFSLNVQLYEKNNLKLTDDFIKNAFNSKLWTDLYEIVDRIAKAIDGKEDTPKDKSGGDDKIKKYLKENELNARVQHLKDALTRPPQEVEISYPKIALGGGWQYEAIDGTEYPNLKGRAGLGYQITLDAKPIIGMEIRWHILDLLCRRHPIAYAVLAAVKALLTAIGDNPDGVKLDFWVKGEINTLVKFHGNALAESKEISVNADTHITAGIDISIMIKGKVVRGKYTAVATLGVGGGAEVGLALATTIGYDKKGLWWQPSFTFDGIKLYFDAVAQGEILKQTKNKNGEYEDVKIANIGDDFHAEITLLAKTFETDKLYFSN